MKRIGEGSTCEVYVNPENPNTVLKVINGDVGCANKEIRMLRNIFHPNVICLVEQYMRLSDVLCFPLYEMDLHTYIYNNPPAKVTRQDCTKITSQILQGVDAIHQAGIMHRDIKPDNIFISSKNLHIVIGDFGWATKIIPGRKNTLEVCAPSYRAPEITLDKLETYTEKIDVFSTAVVIFEVYSRHILFPWHTNIKKQHNTFYTQQELKPNNMDPSQLAAWEKMTQRNPLKRISARDACNAF